MPPPSLYIGGKNPGDAFPILVVSGEPTFSFNGLGTSWALRQHALRQQRGQTGGGTKTWAHIPVPLTNGRLNGRGLLKRDAKEISLSGCLHVGKRGWIRAGRNIIRFDQPPGANRVWLLARTKTAVWQLR